MLTFPRKLVEEEAEEKREESKEKKGKERKERREKSKGKTGNKRKERDEREKFVLVKRWLFFLRIPKRTRAVAIAFALDG